MLHDYLSRLNDVVDPAHAERSERLMLAATSFEQVDRFPVIVACPVEGWQAFSYREGFHDMEKMMVNELAAVWAGARVRDDRAFTIRAYYGVGIIPTMFGCKVELTGDDIPPWFHPLSDDELDRVLDAGPADINAGLGARVFETETFYMDILSRYDNLAKCVHVYLCDTQGPFDLAHLVMGTRIYTDIYDNPERVHRLLDLVSDVCIRFVLAQKELIGEGCDTSYHTQMLLRGAVRLCNDTGINLSTDVFREFARPYDERVLAAVNGGWVHYCGNGKQILGDVLSTPNLTGINFGNPEMQDVEQVLRAAQPSRVALLLWPRHLAIPEWVTTGVTLTASAADLESAAAMLVHTEERSDS